ncbi:MAG: hypothetical protein JRF69_13665 [Deltaproteobacteria bacterium]|nr:hypothetical protein [Deltaproteobacteria bacterium]
MGRFRSRLRVVAPVIDDVVYAEVIAKMKDANVRVITSIPTSGRHPLLGG